MRELHVVAVSEDGRHVVLAASKGAATGSYRVRLDARLVAAVRGELGAPSSSDLSPKEIQARLRAGESVEQIAKAAGVPVTRVERFAGPVAGEVARMIEQAREGHVVRGRLGRSAVALGKAVDAALAEHARPGSAEWGARREDDGRWRVQVAWFARGKTRTAAWRYDPHSRSLEAVDPASAALGHLEEGSAPRRTARPRPAAAPARAATKRAPAKRTKDQPAAPAEVQPRRSTPKRPDRVPKDQPAAPAEVQPRRSTPKRPDRTPKDLPAVPAEVQPGKKAPAKKAPAKKAQPKRTPSKAAPARPSKPAKSAAKATPRPRLQVVPDPPAEVRRRAGDERDGVKARASVPAWADVLLGTTPSSD